MIQYFIPWYSCGFVSRCRANGRRAKRRLLDPDDELLTIKCVAERRKEIDERELRVVVLGPKTYRILLSELNRWWKSRQTKSQNAKPGRVGGH